MREYTFDGYKITPTPVTAAATKKLSHFITDTEHPYVEITPHDMRTNRKLYVQTIKTDDPNTLNVIIGLIPKKYYAWEDIKLDPSFTLECRLMHGSLVEAGVIFAQLRNPVTKSIETIYNRNKIRGRYELVTTRKSSDPLNQDKSMKGVNRSLSGLGVVQSESLTGIDEEFDTLMELIDTSAYLENSKAKRYLDASVYSM